MKKLLFKNWLVLMSLVMACGFTACDDNDDNVGTAPIFPEKQEINLAAGGSQEFSFEANTNWSLSSSAIWCVFVKDEVESFVLSGTPGKQTVTVKMTDDAPAHETSVAKLELTMGGEKVVIGEVRREAQGYDLQLFDEEGNPITELEVGYNDFKRFKVKANYRFAVTNKPSWVKLEGDALVGGINKEVTGGLEIIQDGNMEKYPVTADQKYTLTFASEDGKSEKQIPLVFGGMSAEDMDIVDGPTANRWSWTISEDGKTFTNGAGVAGGGGTSYNKHVSFTLKAKNDDFKIVMINIQEYSYPEMDPIRIPEVMENGWLHYDIKENCNVILTADPLDSESKTAYVLAFPTAKYNELLEGGDILMNIFDENNEFKDEYERYLLMLATQKVIEQTTAAEFKVTDNTLKEIAIKKDTNPTNQDTYGTSIVYTMTQEQQSYFIDPLMGGDLGDIWTYQAWQGDKDVTIGSFFEGVGTQISAWFESDLTQQVEIYIKDLQGLTKKVLIITPNN